MTRVWWITFHSLWNQEESNGAGGKKKLQGKFNWNCQRHDCWSGWFACGAVWDCFLALPSECKPRPSACYSGTARLQLCRSCEEIFKCVQINCAPRCTASLLMCCVPVSLFRDLAICTVSNLICIHYRVLRLVLCNFSCFYLQLLLYYTMLCVFKQYHTQGGCCCCKLYKLYLGLFGSNIK